MLSCAQVLSDLSRGRRVLRQSRHQTASLVFVLLRLAQTRMLPVWLLLGLGSVAGFHGSQEYEFIWFDSLGHEHVNLVSFSQFHTKLTEFYLHDRRPPLKEAFFFTKLSPAYQQALLLDCPFVFVLANLLVAEFHIHDNSAYAEQVYRHAMEIYYNSHQIHQHVTNSAWHLQVALDRFAKEHERLAEHNNHRPLHVLILTTGGPVTELLNHIQRYLPDDTAISVSTRAHDADDTSNLQQAFKVQLRPDISAEQAFLEFVLEIKRTGKDGDFLFLHDEEISDYRDRDLSLPLTIHVLKLLKAGKRDIIPAFFPLSRRLSPSRVSTCASFPGLALDIGYSKGHVFVKAEAIATADVQAIEALLAETENKTCPAELVNQLAARVLGGTRNKTRCDDTILPLSLRLCLGDEHWRGDWRSVHMAPVYPRLAIR